MLTLRAAKLIGGTALTVLALTAAVERRLVADAGEKAGRAWMVEARAEPRKVRKKLDDPLARVSDAKGEGKESTVGNHRGGA